MKIITEIFNVINKTFYKVCLLEAIIFTVKISEVSDFFDSPLEILSFLRSG